MAREKLIAMRRARLLTQEDVAHRIRRDRTTISRIETGEITPGTNTCRALAQLFEVSFEDLWDAVDSNGDGDRPDLVPGWWSNYTTLEQSATSVRTYETVLVPGLLQTEGYAAALLDSDELVMRRLNRQQIVTRREDPVDLAAVVDASVLYRPVGGPGVLAAQLEHLLTMTERPNVSMQVVPYDSPRQPASWGSFVILGFQWPGGLVYLQYHGGAHYLDSPYDLDKHTTAFEQLCDLALPPTKSADLIHHRARELEQ